MAAAVAVALLFGLSACGGGSSDGAKKDSSSQDSGNKDSSSNDSSSDDKSNGELPDPCKLVPIATASEILGEKSAEPDSTSSDLGTKSRACSWSTQSSIDNPSLDNAGHILTLSVIAPPSDSMSVEEFFDAAKAGATDKADVCEKSYWMGGSLSAYQSGVYLTGSAGLADTSADAKAAVTKLMTTACGSL